MEKFGWMATLIRLWQRTFYYRKLESGFKPIVLGRKFVQKILSAIGDSPVNHGNIFPLLLPAVRAFGFSA